MADITEDQDQEKEKRIIIPKRKELELYKCDMYGVINLSEIGTKEGQVSQGVIDVSGFSKLHPIISYWTKGIISTNEYESKEEDKLRLIVESEFGGENLPARLKSHEVSDVLPGGILQGLEFELKKSNTKADEYDLILTPYC